MSTRPGSGALILAAALGLGVFVLCVYSGVIPHESMVKIGILTFIGFALAANLNRLLSLSLPTYSILGLLFLHILNLCRDITIFMDEALFDTGRLPLTLIVALPVLIAGWRGLLTGPGHAAIWAPALYLGWCLLASGFGLDPSHSYFYGGWLLFMCILISITRGLYDAPEPFWDGWLVGLAALGSFNSIASILAIVFDAPGARYQRWIFNSSSGQFSAAPGFSGIFVNPNTLSGTALLALGAAIALVYLRGGKRPPWLEWVLAVCGVATLLSGSRAGIIGLVFVGLSYLWLFRPFRGRLVDGLSPPRPPQSLRGPTLLLIGLILFALSPVGRVGFDRLTSTDEMSRGELGRDEIWMSFFRGLGERPMFGHGYMSRPMSADWETVRMMSGQIAKTSHSAPIEYGMTTGIIGLLLFLWMLWGGVSGLFRPGHKDFGRSAIIFWLCCSPIYLLYAHGNAPSAVAVWPLWVLLLACRSVNGQPQQGAPALPWVLRISRQEQRAFRAVLPPFSSEMMGQEIQAERQADKDD